MLALIDFNECDWCGTCQARVTLAVKMRADSYQSSTQREEALVKLELLRDVPAALQHAAR